MAGVIIWFVFIGWVIYAASKSRKRKSGTGGLRGVAKGQAAGIGQQARRPADAAGQMVQRAPGQSSGATEQSGGWNPAKQQELKERLYQKYKKPQENNILKRGIASAAEDFSDDVLARGRTEGAYQPETGSGSGETLSRAVPGKDIRAGEKAGKEKAGKQKEADAWETGVWKLPEPEEGELLRRVEDLMVKGPDMDLTFSRDFLAEGLEMLK